MCQEFGWVITLASISGVVQSIVWLGLAIAGALVYLCLIPISPYRKESDFFRVTFIKLYFEGPKCIPDGNYLGKFNEDYKSVIDLFTQDRVFAVMIAYVILNAIYFILSIMFYKSRNRPSKRGRALGWSIMCLSLCALDAAFSYVMILDVLTLHDYFANSELNSAKFGEIPYIPLTLALLSTRFIAGWLWNFLIGTVIFVDALCCRNIIKKHPKEEKKKETVQEPQESKETDRRVSVINGYYRNPVPSFNGSPTYKMSMEATTKFNVPEKQSLRVTGPSDQDWKHSPTEAYWNSEPHSGKDWRMVNEGYVSDEEEKLPDFDHDLKNFEAGQRKIKIVKPPLGKPVDPVHKVKQLEKENDNAKNLTRIQMPTSYS